MKAQLGGTWRTPCGPMHPDGDCVEFLVTPEVVGVRDTKNRDGKLELTNQLRIPLASWHSFTRQVSVA